MPTVYRKGAVGALLDEYERALGEFTPLISGVSEAEFMRIVDPDTEDEDCRSIQTITAHVIRAGYGYADYIREALDIPSARPDPELPTIEQAAPRLEAMFAYMLETLAGKENLSYEEATAIQMQVRWGPTYDFEQLFEHAIVHVLRHRRQVERFLAGEVGAGRSATGESV
jgi:hypothetical protein